jgi:DNA-binding SARP family transcriptional activator
VVVDALWPDAPADEARRRLRNVLARLRSAVGSVVVRDGEQLRLADGVVVDLHQFEALAAATRSADASTAEPGRRIDAALDLWAGEPLEAWRYEDWAIPEIERLRTVRDELVARRSWAAS